MLKPCIIYGVVWSNCRWGKGYLDQIKRHDQAKLAKAQKISKKIVNWAKHSKVQPYEPAFQRMITLMVKEGL